MKKKTAAAKKLSQENLAALGAEALADLLLELAASGPSIKRRLRAELAAQVSPADLAAEIDKRLQSLAGSRARISWRKRPEFITDLQVQRRLIAERLGALDPKLAAGLMWDFLGLAPGLAARVKDPREELTPVFEAAATDLGDLIGRDPKAPADLAGRLSDAILTSGAGRWADWIEPVTRHLAPAAATQALALIGAWPTYKQAAGGMAEIIRALAIAGRDPDAYAATIPAKVRTTPLAGAAIAARYLDAGRLEEADKVLRASAPSGVQGAATRQDIAAWEAANVELLERKGDLQGAQAARWAAFEATLAPEPLKDYIARLPDFDDVEAADKAFAHAAAYPDFGRALAFLMAWPALPEAARMILARSGEIEGEAEVLAAWAGQLELRQPLAAILLLKAAARKLAWLHGRHDPMAEAAVAEAERLAAGLKTGREDAAADLRALRAELRL